jgi:hypothetical protein
MTIFRLLVLATSCLAAVAGDDVIGEECVADSYFSDHSTEDTNYTVLEEKERLIAEASYTVPHNLTTPAPRSTIGLGDDLGEPQILHATYSDSIFKRVEESREYMQNTVMTDARFDEVRSLCKNKHASCAFWSVLGECENNPGYMQVNCAPVCKSCEVSMVDFKLNAFIFDGADPFFFDFSDAARGHPLSHRPRGGCCLESR